MSNMQRTKGASAERELAAAIFEELGVKLVRNLDQSRTGGHDLTLAPAQSGPVARALARYALEVKRHARVTPAMISAWWMQAQTQAARSGLAPALAYRGDRLAWRVVLPLSQLRGELPRWQGVEYTAELSLPGFCALVREARG